jgi:CheY-like chemotaxis protein
LRAERTAVNALVQGTIDLLSRTLGETISIETRFGSDVGGILVDPGLLENALLNLALNARDAMPKGGRLVIETRNTVLDASNVATWKDVKPGPYVLISVSDNGTGMTPEIAARAFEPFFTTKDVGKGSGLGLSMVYGFVQQSGGCVGIYSEPGRGTTVRIYLPHLAGEDAPLALADTAEAASQGQGERVVVVEDNEDVRQLVIRQLTSLGYQVEAAADGRQAEAYFRSDSAVDLLISDVVLPGGMSGAEIAAMARRLRPSIPVLYMSGYTEGIIASDQISAEGAVLLPKPFTKAQLSKAIDQVLGRTRKAS